MLMALAGWAFRMEHHHPSLCQQAAITSQAPISRPGHRLCSESCQTPAHRRGLFLAQDGASDPLDAPVRLFLSLNLHATAD